MLQNYFNEHQNDWDVYFFALTFNEYNHMQRSTKTTPLELVLSRPPPSLSFYHSVTALPTLDGETKKASFAEWMVFPKPHTGT